MSYFRLEELIYGSKGKINRDIYMNGVVTMEQAMYITAHIRAINDYDDDFEKERKEQGEHIAQQNGLKEVVLKEVEREPIRLHISSYGGEVMAGNQIINAIKHSNTEVHAYVTTAISMGFAVASICDYRIGYENSYFLCHNISYGAGGNHEEIVEQVESSQLLSDMLFKQMTEFTKIPKKIIKKIKKRKLNKVFMGEECLEYGLLDLVLPPNTPAHVVAEEFKKEQKVQIPLEDGTLYTLPTPENLAEMTDEELTAYAMDYVYKNTDIFDIDEAKGVIRLKEKIVEDTPEPKHESEEDKAPVKKATKTDIKKVKKDELIALVQIVMLSVKDPKVIGFIEDSKVTPESTKAELVEFVLEIMNISEEAGTVISIVLAKGREELTAVAETK